MGKKTRNDAVINMRARPADIAIIDQAARALGKTRSAFMREAAEREARKVFAKPKLIRAR